MAVAFDGNDYLYHNGEIGVAHPFTLYAEVAYDASQGNSYPVAFGAFSSTSGTDYALIYNESAYDNCLVQMETSTNSAMINLGTWSTDGSFNRVALVSWSGASRYGYLDGSESSEDTTNVGAMGTLDRVAVGSDLFSGSSSYPMVGDVGQTAFWNVALTTAEATALTGDGVSPLLIRPQSLIWYAPLRTVETADWTGHAISTSGDPTMTTGPYTAYPTRPLLSRVASVAGGNNLAWKLAGRRPSLAGLGGLAG